MMATMEVCFQTHSNICRADRLRTHADFQTTSVIAFATGCQKCSVSGRIWNAGGYEQFCTCPNKIMLGFEILDAKESTRTVHDMVYARFEHAPEIKLYDNACNCHKTAMKLDPCYWADTVFCTDRAHEPTHVACSPAFRMGSYSQMDGINSQTAEQFHAALERSDITGSLSHMSQVHFMLSERFYMFLNNIRSRIRGRDNMSLRALIEEVQIELLQLQI